VGDAHVDEVFDAGFGGCRDRSFAGYQIDGFEFGSFGWTWMCHSDKLDEGVTRGNLIAKGFLFERIADGRFAAGRKFGFRGFPSERADFMPASEQKWNQA
jgi:hypothetical protein